MDKKEVIGKYNSACMMITRDAKDAQVESDLVHCRTRTLAAIAWVETRKAEGKLFWTKEEIASFELQITGPVETILRKEAELAAHDVYFHAGNSIKW